MQNVSTLSGATCFHRYWIGKVYRTPLSEHCTDPRWTPSCLLWSKHFSFSQFGPQSMPLVVTLTYKIASANHVHRSSRVKERWKWMQGDHGTCVLLIDRVVTGTVDAGAMITEMCLVWHISVCPRNASIRSTHNNKWGLCRANWETGKGLAFVERGGGGCMQPKHGL